MGWLNGKRKILMALGSVLTVVLTNVGLPEETAGKITEAVVDIAMWYLGGQATVDAVKALKQG